ncbi:MAG: hypothetical protein ACI9LM_005629, partial [Alteromonadaceae bacterium]
FLFPNINRFFRLIGFNDKLLFLDIKLHDYLQGSN